MLCKIFILFITISWLNCVQGQSCTRNYDNVAGLCMPGSQCPKVIRDYKLGGIKPELCSVVSDEPIICCPHKYITNNKPTNGSSTVLPSSNRLSATKCKEYNQLFDNEQFGSNEVCRDTTSLIVGGVKAKRGEFPHMAAVGVKIGRSIHLDCGGALISERFVLTAAHCNYFGNHAVNIVRLGAVKLKTRNNQDHQDYDIERFIKPPNYSAQSHYNDIGLIQLTKNVVFGMYVRPACLWSNDVIQQPKSIAIGWGTTEFGEAKKSNDLLKVSLDIISLSKCRNLYSNLFSDKLSNGISSSQLCAGVLSGGKDSCQGDSGAPLLIKTDSHKCKYHIVGVTSFGLVCGAVNQPGIYTRVAAYIEWIEKFVWQ